MKYCKKCVMPDTRPGITFNEEGVCSACQQIERRKTIDWSKRWEEFEAICSKYRGMNDNGYDCAIAVSGGKDSHYQVHLMKNVMHMNPILFSGLLLYQLLTLAPYEQNNIVYSSYAMEKYMQRLKVLPEVSLPFAKLIRNNINECRIVWQR